MAEAAALADAARFEAQANEAAQRRDFAAAAEALRQANQIDPGSFPRWMKLVSMRRALADHGGVLAALSRALALQPLDFTALLLKAATLEAQDADADVVGEAYRRALAQRPPAGVPVPAGISERLAHAEQIAERYSARQIARIAAAADAVQSGEARDARVAAKTARFASNIVRQTRTYHQQPTMFDYPGLRNVEFFDREELPFLSRLEAATPLIEAEFKAIFAAEAQARMPYINYRDDLPLAQWAELNRSERWSAIHLIQGGKVTPEAERHCPKTLAAFAEADQPHIAGLSPNLMFSLLAPHTHIPPHHGVSNTRIVFHLPLIVPPGCGFRVGGETREWMRGEAFAFDDTIEHEAWNDSDELRVIVIADMWRPELSRQERAIAGAMMVAAGIDAGAI